MGGTLTFFLSLLIVVRHLGLVWKMKLATVVLALVLFVSQASAELEPVLLAVQEKATYKSKVVNETLLPYAIEALIEEKKKNTATPDTNKTTTKMEKKNKKKMRKKNKNIKRKIKRKIKMIKRKMKMKKKEKNKEKTKRKQKG